VPDHFSSDALTDYLGPDAAAALETWQRMTGRRVHIPSSSWRATGYTGALVAALIVTDPGKPPVNLVVKVCPDLHGDEPAVHRKAHRVSPPEFVDQHLVPMPFDPVATPGHGIVMFQQIAGGSRDFRPISELPGTELVETCQAVATSLIRDWNRTFDLSSQENVIDFFANEVDEQTGSDLSMRRWTESVGLTGPGSAWLTTPEDERPLPNPFFPAVSDSPAAGVTFDCLRGLSHSDLHLENILSPRSVPMNSAEFKLIDLSTFQESAPLVRDQANLLLSVVGKMWATLTEPQRRHAISLVVAPDTDHPDADRGLVAAVRGIYLAGREAVAEHGWADAWRVQFPLAVQAAALRFTSFENLGSDRRWWFFRLAAHAAAEFLRSHGRDTPAANPVPVTNPFRSDTTTRSRAADFGGLLRPITGTVVDMLRAAAPGEAADKLRDDAVGRGFQHALGSALLSYGQRGTRLDLVTPLLRRLSTPDAANEFAHLLLFDREPDIELLATTCADALTPVTFADPRTEVRLLLRFLDAELRETEIFRPVFEQRSLGALNTPNAAADTEDQSDDTDVESDLASLAELSETGFAGLVRTFRTTPPGLRDHIRPANKLIQERTQDFVGRQFVFDALRDFMRSEPNGYFIINSKPGVGKTALAAELVRRHGYVHHFNSRQLGIDRANTFLTNVCAQLIVSNSLPIAALGPDAGKDGGYLDDVLHQVSAQLTDDQQAVIVIDALDEVNTTDHQYANCLYLPMTLDDRIYIVATTRSDTPVQLRMDCAFTELTIEAQSEDNLQDIRTYLSRRTTLSNTADYRRQHKLSELEFVALLTERSEGNFMYLQHVLPAIIRGEYDPDTIPVGLRSYYNDHWNRMQAGDDETWIRYKLPVLMALTVFNTPLSVDRIAEFSGVDDRVRVGTVLRQWSQFLEAERVEHKGATQVRHRIYHASFYEFLSQREEIGDLSISHREATERAMNRLTDDLFGDA